LVVRVLDWGSSAVAPDGNEIYCRVSFESGAVRTPVRVRINPRLADISVKVDQRSERRFGYPVGTVLIRIFTAKVLLLGTNWALI
jgi:hypothetical protein